MKKIFCLILVLILTVSVFTSCGQKEEKEFIETITFEKIAQVNSVTNLLKKYDRITEKTVNKDLEDGGEFSWNLSYEKSENGINAIVDTGDQYKCFYYNNKIFACYDGEYLPVLYFRETYNDIVAETVKRDNILNAIFHTVVSRGTTNDGRYTITFEFKATPDMLNDFETWDVQTGQKMHITYFLKENLEIDHYDYYLFDKNGNKKNIANIYIDYDSKFTFPEDVINLANTKDTCRVTLYENYGLGSQYTETYDVPRGSYLEINSYLYSYNIFTDKEMKKYWNFANNSIEKNTDLYLKENIYYEVEEETGDTIITREESENE